MLGVAILVPVQVEHGDASLGHGAEAHLVGLGLVTDKALGPIGAIVPLHVHCIHARHAVDVGKAIVLMALPRDIVKQWHRATLDDERAEVQHGLPFLGHGVHELLVLAPGLVDLGHGIAVVGVPAGGGHELAVGAQQGHDPLVADADAGGGAVQELQGIGLAVAQHGQELLELPVLHVGVVALDDVGHLMYGGQHLVAGHVHAVHVHV